MDLSTSQSDLESRATGWLRGPGKAATSIEESGLSVTAVFVSVLELQLVFVELPGP